MSTITITVPDLSGATDVDVVEVLVKAGDTLAEGDSLIALETDKAAMEVPAEQAGTVVEVLIKEGGTCNEGDAILTLSQVAAQSVSPAPARVEESRPDQPEAKPQSSPAPAGSQVTEVRVPDLSGATDVDVVEVMVKAGDTIAEGDSLIALETDKASMEVPAPVGGRVVEVKIQPDSTCNEGDLLLLLEAGESNAPSMQVVAGGSAVTPAASVGVEAVQVPDLSGATDVDVIEVMVKPGDTVVEGDGLIALETDKASMEVPSPKAGTVVEVAIQEGSTCNEGDLILTLEVTATALAPVADPAASASNPPSPAASVPARQSESVADLKTLEQKNRLVHAGPAVRAIAREFGVELSAVRGSGRKGRIVKEDVQAYVKSALQQLKEQPKGVAGGAGIPAIPEVDFSQFGEIELEKLSKIAKVTRENMARCWLNIPHVTQFDEADITDLEAFRADMKEQAAKAGVKLTPLPFMIKAVAKALAANPKFNASLHADGEHLVYKKYIHIGLAVDTPNGLMVPVIRDADKKDIYQLANEAIELAGKAKERKLKPNEMQGACFTISSLGGIGGTGFTPIVNAPEVGILGVSKADIKPRWNGEHFEPRKMLPLCLSYDHRAINGGDAGRFLTYLNELLSDIRRLVL